MSLQVAEPIAIVGSACRFSGSANSPSKLWELLRQPRDLRREVSATRFSAKGFYHHNGAYHGHSNVAHAYLLDDEDDLSAFDAEFFGIKPSEAKAMDPQQRVLLEVAYEALESAGLPLARLKGSDTAVYVGSMTDDYTAMLLRDLQDTPTYAATGTARSILSNRLSYVFDWRGPSVSLDTACSSSLVAVHMAVQALRAGDTKTALACGTNLILGPENFIIESKLNMLSPDGRSRMWDQGANGYARGDGVAALVLKTLSAALADGDHIECIIRETGLNQDGTTTGITMPSVTAQEALICKTYAKAGLNLGVRSDRPQYFEAHGTGTPAGDPIEAEAIYNALGSRIPDSGEEDPLYVGSIKTVIGHTEGTAGIAAILKASLALRHASIPPNLWLEHLSNRVAPFYKNVQIPLAQVPWPGVAEGKRRASVNSFGFGGTNAHAILESYDATREQDEKDEKDDGGHDQRKTPHVLFTPFVFSASSRQSLTASLRAYLDVLDGKDGDVINPDDLAWTLRQRRSVLGWRESITASSLGDLRAKLRVCLGGGNVGLKALPASQGRILGIFTGQGAQYARMGAELIRQSKAARDIVRGLELHLSELPDGDAPAWSLEAELLADAPSSRVYEAAVSQPLCTAVQILLADLLRLAGVQLDVVVGHSSGEIAAAYSAGFLTARDAMCIAYYRGMHLQQAFSPHPSGRNVNGAMLAVGTSPEDAAELCADSVFKGRIVVAAINSPSSVTISGDQDAIAELEMVLEDDKIFHRRLMVDRAYHSPHMLPHHDPYVASLRRCGIAPQTPGPGRATWFSSVYGGMTGAEVAAGLGDAYWAANLTRPVLFSQAVSHALAAQACDLIVEIGPHPALKGPVCQVVAQHDVSRNDVSKRGIPYHGTLARGTNAVEAVSSVLGFLWVYLDRSRIDLSAYEHAANGGIRRYKLVKDLPTYSWNHDAKYWHESRRSLKTRKRPSRVHPLLGDVSPDSAAHHMCWNHVVSVSEMGWLSGHQVQGQVVFPAAGYICTAVEASRSVADAVYPGKTIRVIEMRDFAIHQPIAFDDSTAAGGVEVLISMHDITRRSPDRASARFTYSVAPLSRQHVQDLTLAAGCVVDIHVGSADPSLLSARRPILPHMLDVESERFYTALADLGYGFGGRFRSLSGMYRKHGRSSCLVKMGSREEEEEEKEEGEEEKDENLLIHPAELDAVLQSIILAHSYPSDGELQTIHLPTVIRQIRVNPALYSTVPNRQQQDWFAAVDAAVAEREAGQRGIVGHANLYSDSSSPCAHAAIQVHGATFMPFGDGTPAEEGDRKLFSKIEWIRSRPDGKEAARHIVLSQEQRDMAALLERIAVFYLRKFDREIPPDHVARSTFPNNMYLKFARHVTSVAESGGNPWVQSSTCLGDTLQDVVEASEPFSHLPDFRILHLIGAQMPRVFNGETTMLEQFRSDDNDNILDRFYSGAFGMKEAAEWVGRSVKQIVDRHAHMNILEIGAGTGGGTKAVFREIDQGFLSYTYTDISAAFFKDATSTFSQHKDRMIFKTLDVERDPIEQGYAKNAYDIVVAFLVLHATSDIARCLSHLHKLLKPGGFLVVAEGYDAWDGVAATGCVWGPLPGWWLRADTTGQALTPHPSPEAWDELLRSTGFSGVDTSIPTALRHVLGKFCFVSQAMKGDIGLLRQPLAASPSSILRGLIQKLVIVGGRTSRTLRLVEGLREIFAGRDGFGIASEVYHFETLLDVDYDVLDVHSTVISLADLDMPVFKDIGPEVFMSLKAMFGTGKSLLWVTSGRLEDEPFSNMAVGFGNVAVNETPDLRLQQLDIGDPTTTKPETIAEVLLRFHSTAGAVRSNALVWTVEPEIVLDKDGHELLPRMRSIPELNDRYNSGRRPVVCEIQPGKPHGPITLRLEPASGGGGGGGGGSALIVRELPRRDALPAFEANNADAKPCIELRTKYSTLSAIQTPLGHRFLALGFEPKTGTEYLALVPSPMSAVRLPATSVVPYLRRPDSSDGQSLSVIAAHLVAMHILHPLLAGQTLVAHNASSSMITRALTIQASARGVRVVFTTDSVGSEVPESWIRLPRYVIQSDVEEILFPINPSSFVGFSNEVVDTEKTENQAALIECLRGRCRFLMTAGIIFCSTGSDKDESFSISDPGDTLQQALEWAAGRGLRPEEENAYPGEAIGTPFRLGDIARGAERPKSPLSAVDWTVAEPLPVRISRLDSRTMFKGENSSYWIVGMSRALGLSLADWMISKGAKTLVMTSRKPEIDPAWIASHHKKGVNIAIVPCDITDELALQAVYSQIRATLPPITGVINGAMVLRDTTIRDMSFDQLADVIGPKVDGSIHLDRIFRHTDLDFFVLVSSINRVYGNHGQANYAAANAFLWGLSAQRRKRGLRAAAVDVGAIIGAGYLERELRPELDAIVERQSMLRMSEEDWCQSVCEAIEACRLESPHGPGLTTGFSEVPLNIPRPPSWYANPIFSAFVVSQRATEEKAEAKAAVAIREQLRVCQSKEDVWQVVKGSFAAQMRSILQVTTTDEDLMASHGSGLGLDSLVSVDIRLWFRNNLQVNIPVLKILGTETMASLVRYAVENMPTELVTGLNVEPPDETDQERRAAKHSTETAQTLQLVSDDGDAVSTVATSSSGDTTGVADAHKRDSSPNDGHGIVPNWEMESRPPANMAGVPISSLDPSLLPWVRNPPHVVVLTGCTGLLGRHLLSYFMAQPSVQRIICLAVRSLSARTQQGKLPNNDPRVTYHAGDLAQPLLGLPWEEAALVFAEADVVIHNGADTSHLKHYSDMRAANVGSTTVLAQLCLPRRIPLHYVSTAGLGLWHENGRTQGFAPGPVRLAPDWEPDGSSGYLCSKWTCERLLERTSSAYGLRVCIHRPSTIVREGEDALGRQAETDWVNAFLAYARLLKAVPRAEKNRGDLDLVYVRTVCEGIIARVFHGERADGDGDGDDDDHSAQKKTTEDESDVIYVHEVGDQRLPLGELQHAIARGAGSDEVSFEVLPLEEWIAKALAAGLHPGVAALIESVDDEDFPRLVV